MRRDPDVSSLGQRSAIFKEGVEKGYFLLRSNGDVWQWLVPVPPHQLTPRDLWQPSMALVDFTNPQACEWYAGLVAKLLDTGVDTIKTDFGERVPHLGVKWHDNSDPWKMHKWVMLP